MLVDLIMFFVVGFSAVFLLLLIICLPGLIRWLFSVSRDGS